MKRTGQHIYLRYLEEADVGELVRLQNQNRAFFELYATTRREDFYSEESQLNRIKKSIEMKEEDKQYTFGIYLIETNELIGVIDLTEVVRGPMQACWLGYFLDRAQNGRGYTTEAVRLIVDFAFRTLKLHRIEAGVMPHNLGSIKVLEKSGFEREGLSKKNVQINGKWEDHLHFAVVNPND